ncbi:MAG: DotU family type IV/VI secretion system protein [Planctomycetaceae bacterium]|nr:DotU family type IV/VI secretion system protein [Planctomycetaceae bacterium]
MSQSIISLAEPFFLKVLGLLEREPPDDEDHLRRLQRQLTADIQAIQAQVNAGAVSVSGGEWETIKRVLIYWADEVLTRHIRDWADFTLEHQYYGSKHRAWKFYVEGEEAIPTAGSEVAELFYLAMVLGFEGDIEGAFRDELQKDMPGGHQEESAARKYWAGQLQRRIRYDASSEIQGEPLEGNVDPLPSPVFWRASLAFFLIALLLFVIVLGWKAFRSDDATSVALPTDCARRAV